MNQSPRPSRKRFSSFLRESISNEPFVVEFQVELDPPSNDPVEALLFALEKATWIIDSFGIEEGGVALKPIEDGLGISGWALWCGHTTKVMYQHYTRIKDADSASTAALQAFTHGGSTSGDAGPVGVVAPVVSSVFVSAGKEPSPATEAAGDDGFMEFADDSGELVTVGGDFGDHQLVDLIGLEPTTSSMPWKRSSN